MADQFCYDYGDPGPGGGIIFALPFTGVNNTKYYYEASKETIELSRLEAFNNTMQISQSQDCNGNAAGPFTNQIPLTITPMTPGGSGGTNFVELVMFSSVATPCDFYDNTTIGALGIQVGDVIQNSANVWQGNVKITNILPNGLVEIQPNNPGNWNGSLSFYPNPPTIVQLQNACTTTTQMGQPFGTNISVGTPYWVNVKHQASITQTQTSITYPISATGSEFGFYGVEGANGNLLGMDFGDGWRNTQTIVSPANNAQPYHTTHSIAAQQCVNHAQQAPISNVVYDDWYLPSLEEIKEVRSKLGKFHFYVNQNNPGASFYNGPLTNTLQTFMGKPNYGSYWTSSDYSTDSSASISKKKNRAPVYRPQNNSVSARRKCHTYSVLPIRRFECELIDPEDVKFEYNYRDGSAQDLTGSNIKQNNTWNFSTNKFDDANYFGFVNPGCASSFGLHNDEDHYLDPTSPSLHPQAGTGNYIAGKRTAESNRNDACVGLPWFGFGLNHQDCMGVKYSEQDILSGGPYEITIWDYRKKFLGKWTYSECLISQKDHPVYSYGLSGQHMIKLFGVTHIEGPRDPNDIDPLTGKGRLLQPVVNYGNTKPLNSEHGGDFDDARNWIGAINQVDVHPYYEGDPWLKTQSMAYIKFTCPGMTLAYKLQTQGYFNPPPQFDSVLTGANTEVGMPWIVCTKKGNQTPPVIGRIGRTWSHYSCTGNVIGSGIQPAIFNGNGPGNSTLKAVNSKYNLGTWNGDWTGTNWDYEGIPGITDQMFQQPSSLGNCGGLTNGDHMFIHRWDHWMHVWYGSRIPIGQLGKELKWIQSLDHFCINQAGGINGNPLIIPVSIDVIINPNSNSFDIEWGAGSINPTFNISMISSGDDIIGFDCNGFSVFPRKTKVNQILSTPGPGTPPFTHTITTNNLFSNTCNPSTPITIEISSPIFGTAGEFNIANANSNPSIARKSGDIVEDTCARDWSNNPFSPFQS